MKRDSSPSRTTDIESRLERLETENRKLRYGVGALALVGVSVAMLGVSDPQLGPGGVADVVRARRFEVINDNGRVAAELDHLMNFGRLAIRDDQGELGVWAATRSGQGGAVFTLNRGEKLVELSSTIDGEGVVTSYNSRTRGRLVDLIPNTQGGGALVTYDERGARLVTLSVTNEGEGVVATYNRAGGLQATWPIDIAAVERGPRPGETDAPSVPAPPPGSAVPSQAAPPSGAASAPGALPRPATAAPAVGRAVSPAVPETDVVEEIPATPVPDPSPPAGRVEF